LLAELDWVTAWGYIWGYKFEDLPETPFWRAFWPIFESSPGSQRNQPLLAFLASRNRRTSYLGKFGRSAANAGFRHPPPWWPLISWFLRNILVPPANATCWRFHYGFNGKPYALPAIASEGRLQAGIESPRSRRAEGARVGELIAGVEIR
jgi:hypothetical protein